jgi:hypothetical protein
MLADGQFFQASQLVRTTESSSINRNFKSLAAYVDDSEPNFRAVPPPTCNSVSSVYYSWSALHQKFLEHFHK